MNFFDKKVLEKLWWYGLNIITTLFIISFINFNAPQGEPGLPGSNGANGVNGVDGEDGQGVSSLYPVLNYTYDAMPVGNDRAAYAQALVEDGYIPLSTPEDFEIFTVVDDEPDFYGNEFAYNDRYVLVNDIDFSEADLDLHKIGAYAYNGDDTFAIYFEGVFDGAGYSIKNFTSRQGEYNFSNGFFPYTSEAVIRNITFENHSIATVLYEGYTGGLIGFNNGPTVVENVTMVNVELVSDTSTGGIVGGSNDELYLLNTDVQMGYIAGYNAGGLVGYSMNEYNTYIQDSINKATIGSEYFFDEYANYLEGVINAGGLIGFAESTTSLVIHQSSNEGTIITDAEAAGGLVGRIDYSDLVVVSSSFNSGYVASLYLAEADLGGLIGRVDSLQRPFYIQNSFNIGHVYAKYGSSLGGLVGSYINAGDFPWVSPTMILNSYNAGYLATSEYFNATVGGLLGYVDRGIHFTLKDTFNVGYFSESVIDNDPIPLNQNNGAIVGSLAGNVVLDNVTYFYDEEAPQTYVDHAINRRLDGDTLQIRNLADFEEDAFMYVNQWDFESVWMFENGAYAFPVLQFDPTFALIDAPSYLPYLEDSLFEVYLTYNDDVETRTFRFLDFWVGDAETTFDDLEYTLYGSKGIVETEDSVAAIVQALETDADLAGSFLGSDLEDEVLIEYEPTQGPGTYYMYLVVEDNDGNQDVNVIYDWTLSIDETAPVPGGLGLISAFFYDLPRDVEVQFEQATDNVTAQADLDYFVIVAVDGFNFDTWNLDWENPNILHASLQLQDEPGIIRFSLGFDMEPNLAYSLALYVQDDALNLARYTPTTLIYAD